MPNRPAFVGAVFAAIAALLWPQRASADGNLVLYCAVQEEWSPLSGCRTSAQSGGVWLALIPNQALAASLQVRKTCVSSRLARNHPRRQYARSV
jgi:hypothetical protein